MIFIPTNTNDGTADVLVGLLTEIGVPFFRWNIDLWAKYRVDVSPGKFIIEDPVGRQCDIYSKKTTMIWRKPVVGTLVREISGLSDEDFEFLKTELNAFVRFIAATFSHSSRWCLVEPFASSRIPKILQLEIASRYFLIPDYYFGVSERDFHDSSVVKPLGGSQLMNGNIFYTTKVSPQSLRRPFPWYLQKAIISGSDITAVFIDGDVRFFRSMFKRNDNSVDWRVEINTESQSAWQRAVELEESYGDTVLQLMRELGLKFGRLDFILSDENLYFLECNPNGQFGWLDNDEMDLHKCFISACLRHS